ncbi:small cell adhesion glycoprotein homolog [Acanthopagrus schlegelii]
MEFSATPGPGTPSSATEAVTKGPVTDDGDFAALIGGMVGGVLLLLICVITVLLWCLSRQKGSYVTNETDDDDDIDIDDESVGSDTALQSKERLKAKDEE